MKGSFAQFLATQHVSSPLHEMQHYCSDIDMVSTDFLMFNQMQATLLSLLVTAL
ncbi:hypothetical protein AcetOrient_orf04732 [Acetobacter orientalis]|uniref:Uncharacterized protein n=1 Tax=Acetobacter orientalis TaxID=146474 RepID=A0A2Z5ZMA5_9PROT|nr:hypothetical protein AcetOrient_orf04732 [Acetobacter orientalis]